MKVFSWQEIISKKNVDFFKLGTALSIGCFDGPHKGHQILFNDVLEWGVKNKSLKGLLTFTKSLSNFKESNVFSKNISTIGQRLKIFEKLGFDFIILVDFNQNFSKLNGTEFFDILTECINLKFLAEGADFKCANKGLCTQQEIKKIAIKNNFICKFERLLNSSESNLKISSSIIKNELLNANFDLVQKMLIFDFELDLQDCKIEQFENKCKISGFTQVLPKDGVYNVIFNTNRTLRSRLEVKSAFILVDLPFNEISRIRSIIFINKE